MHMHTISHCHYRVSAHFTYNPGPNLALLYTMCTQAMHDYLQLALGGETYAQ